MSLARKKFKRDLHKPDELITVTARAVRFIEEHQKLVISILLGIIGICILVMGGIYFYRSTITQGERDLFHAGQTLNPDRKESDELPRAIENFQGVLNDYSFSRIRVKAQLELGHLYFRQGDHEKALSMYQEVVQTASPDSSVRGIAMLNLARSLAKLGREKEALTWLTDLERGGYLVSRPEVLYSIAQVYRQQGNAEKSLEYLKKVSDLFPQFLRGISLSEKAIEAYSKSGPDH
jgi:tetratricopeptide (TPR) repeat protein